MKKRQGSQKYRRSNTKPRPARPPKAIAPITRDSLRKLVKQTLEPLDYVHALWEGGSAAFGEADVWSDMDLQVCVDDDRVDDTFTELERILAERLPVERRLIVPEPTWHGHAQRFYRFRDAPPWLLLDFCVEKRSNDKRLWETEIHGEQPMLFDKINLAATKRPLDPEEKEKLLRRRIVQLRERVSMFGVFVDKELRRHHPLDAFAFYQMVAITPLVEALRIRHDPWRHDWGTRYLYRCLSKGDLRKLESLIYVRNPAELSPKTRAAHRWFHALINELENRRSLMPKAQSIREDAIGS